MSCCHESLPQEVRPGTARVLVTELSGSGHINPTPAQKTSDDSETAVDLYLSPEKLKFLCGAQDLSYITSLELCVDTQENTLGNFGAYLPKLVQLKMNNSRIVSVRDLGTTLSHLQVLWMSRCSLKDLDGISTLTSLKELYVAYNSVSDLSPVGMLENLQLLDLEGNDVDDLVQIQCLGLCCKLQTLTLEGNPVCVRPNPTDPKTADYSYRASIRELIPQLCYLDDVRVEEDRQGSSSIMGEDWVILQNSIRECNVSNGANENEEAADSGCFYSRPSSARRPVSSHSCVWPFSSSDSRPHTGSRPMSAIRPGVLSPPGSRPGSADSADVAEVEAETSILTHGAGKILFCGNPVQAIRARREKLMTAPTRSTFTPCDLPIHVPEHTYDTEEPDVRERSDVFAELRAWREQHTRRLQAIEADRLPQVLAIKYSDDEEEEDDNEEEGFCGVRYDSSDEEPVVEKQGDKLDSDPLDSSFQSVSPDLHHSEGLSPVVAQLCLSSNTTVSPSPPVRTTAACGHQKPRGIRARRLRHSHTTVDLLPVSGKVGCFPGTDSTVGDTDLALQRAQQVTRTDMSLLLQAPHKSALGEGLGSSRLQSNVSCVQSGHKHQRTRLRDRPSITRPHTAGAALQKHHQRHALQDSRGSSHPDWYQNGES